MLLLHYDPLTTELFLRQNIRTVVLQIEQNTLQLSGTINLSDEGVLFLSGAGSVEILNG